MKKFKEQINELVIGILCVVSLFTMSMVTHPVSNIKTVTSGNINTASTFDCNCLPSATTNVIVSSGDTLKVNANVDVLSIQFEANSFLRYMGSYTITSHQ